MELQEINKLRNNGYYVAMLDGSKCKDVNDFLTEAAKIFQFPDYFGGNINSFLECINDLDWLDEPDYAIVIFNSKLFLSNDTQVNKDYVNGMLKDISKEWMNVPNFPGEEAFRSKADFKLLNI